MADFDLNGILGMARQVQENMAKAQEQLAQKTVEAQSGGGLVTVVASCAREIVKVTIDPQALAMNDVPMLQDLIVAACNSALRKAADVAREEMAKVTGGLPIPPGLF